MKQKHIIKATIYDKRGRILSIGYNKYEKSHPKQKEYADRVGLPFKQFLHAEIAALVKVRSGIPHKIKIERYGKNGQPLCAKPCPICQLAIQEAQIKIIEYTL